MFGIIVDTEFAWGFQARVVGLSKTTPSFYYPPPTTFLGAIAEAIARKSCLGEDKGKKIAIMLGEKVLALGIRPINCIPIKYSDINRIISIRILGELGLVPDPRDFTKSFDSPARGKTLMMSYDDNPPVLRWLLVLDDNKLSFNGKAFSLLDKKYFWAIHRLGSKESRVSVLNVGVVENIEENFGMIVTKYSFPMVDGVTPEEQLQVRWMYEIYTDPRKLGYDKTENPLVSYMMGENLVTYSIPIKETGDPEFRIKVSKPAVAYKIGDEYVVGWEKQ